MIPLVTFLFLSFLSLNATLLAHQANRGSPLKIFVFLTCFLMRGTPERCIIPTAVAMDIASHSHRWPCCRNFCRSVRPGPHVD